MTSELVQYRCASRVATITMDDGKRNALSPRMFAALYEAIDRAEADEAAIVLTGRDEVFSAGYDLKVMKGGGADTLRMLRAGYSMTARLLSYPYPVVSASPGHAYAMGAFMMLSTDYRFGVPGPYTYVANEVAIGLPMPRTGAAVLRLRLTPAAYQVATGLAQAFDPEGAVAAGFVDALVPKAELLDRAHAKASELMELDLEAHRISKLRVREEVLATIRRGIPLDLADAALIGAKQMIRSRLRKR